MIATHRTLAITGVALAAAGGWAVSASSGPDPVELQARMGSSLLDLDSDQAERFVLGKLAFERTLTVEEGLGPTFNQTSCASCHNNPVGGHGNQTVTRFGHIGKKGGFDPLDSVGGSLLQANAINDDCIEILPPESNISSLRVTLGSLGFGLIEAVDDASIIANRDAQDASVRGEARTVALLESPTESRIGRFGWKSTFATVLSFSADAAINEMGLTNRIIDEENAPNGDQAALLECDAVPDPEDVADSGGVEFIDRVTDFQRFIAAPPQTPRSGMTGEAVFVSIGCAQCHTQSFTTTSDTSFEAVFRDREIRPYSDFLLHDMGIASDGIVDGTASGREMRTPVLWGVRDRNPLWHDGRFSDGTFDQRVRDAIDEHDVFASQGQDSAVAFAALPASSKDDLVQFLDSLGRAEFDTDGNDEIDLDDFLGVDEAPFGFSDCWQQTVTPDDPCAVHDIDQNGIVDEDDLDPYFLSAYDDPLEDCDLSGQPDLVEILQGVLVDSDDNGVPDSCQCPGDITGDGLVGVDDLLVVISGWGPCSIPCPADTDHDGIVGVSDLLQVILDWGICPSGA
ncbi:MAG: hypothetical protein CMJ24_01070 [Phycisphaerae bacterium]|nr:hypothetical protein [Phycisphaerae bacterium]|tara:strand:+ start:2956 stop:4662 length:1707 start_codon:yes stop_codon:yes gene_type:complete